MHAEKYHTCWPAKLHSDNVTFLLMQFSLKRMSYDILAESAWIATPVKWPGPLQTLMNVFAQFQLILWAVLVPGKIKSTLILCMVVLGTCPTVHVSHNRQVFSTMRWKLCRHAWPYDLNQTDKPLRLWLCLIHPATGIIGMGLKASCTGNKTNSRQMERPHRLWHCLIHLAIGMMGTGL